jgi:WD40 repeat protein
MHRVRRVEGMAGGLGLAVSADGAWVARVFHGGDVPCARVWRAGSLREDSDARMLPVPLPGPSDCAFSPDGRHLAVAAGNSILLWDWAAQCGARELRVNDERLGCCAFAPDGLLLAAGSDSTAYLWRLGAGDEAGVLPAVLQLSAGARLAVTSCAFSANGSLLATGTASGAVRLWSRCGDFRRALCGHMDVVSACAFAADGSVLVTASLDGLARCWSPWTGECLTTLTMGVPLHNCALSPCGRSVAFASSHHGMLGLWRPFAQDAEQRLAISSSSSSSSASWAVLDGSTACAFLPGRPFLLLAVALPHALELWVSSTVVSVFLLILAGMRRRHGENEAGRLPGKPRSSSPAPRLPPELWAFICEEFFDGVL